MNEDRLLARIESLESNLALLSKNESMQNVSSTWGGRVIIPELIKTQNIVLPVKVSMMELGCIPLVKHFFADKPVLLTSKKNQKRSFQRTRLS